MECTVARLDRVSRGHVRTGDPTRDAGRGRGRRRRLRSAPAGRAPARRRCRARRCCDGRSDRGEDPGRQHGRLHRISAVLADQLCERRCGSGLDGRAGAYRLCRRAALSSGRARSFRLVRRSCARRRVDDREPWRSDCTRRRAHRGRLDRPRPWPVRAHDSLPSSFPLPWPCRSSWVAKRRRRRPSCANAARRHSSARSRRLSSSAAWRCSIVGGVSRSEATKVVWPSRSRQLQLRLQPVASWRRTGGPIRGRLIAGTSSRMCTRRRPRLARRTSAAASPTDTTTGASPGTPSKTSPYRAWGPAPSACPGSTAFHRRERYGRALVAGRGARRDRLGRAAPDGGGASAATRTDPGRARWSRGLADRSCRARRRRRLLRATRLSRLALPDSDDRHSGLRGPRRAGGRRRSPSAAGVHRTPRPGSLGSRRADRASPGRAGLPLDRSSRPSRDERGDVDE